VAKSGSFLVGLTLWETGPFPLRRSVESTGKRDLRNLAMAGISAMMLQMTEQPLANGIHHSIVQGQTDCNWSSDVRDRLHGPCDWLCRRTALRSARLVMRTHGEEDCSGCCLHRGGKRMCATHTSSPDFACNSSRPDSRVCCGGCSLFDEFARAPHPA
jgi:hypothetical protein